MKSLTYNKYRIINIFLLSVIFVVIETMITLGATKWFPELAYTLSLCIIFTSLEMMRWKGFGAVAAVLSGLTYCIVHAGTDAVSWKHFLIYCIGNLFMLLALVYLKLVGHEKVRKSALLSIIYVLLVFLLAQVGRWTVSGIIEKSFSFNMLIQFLTTDALSGVFAIVVILILRKADGMFEEQRAYLQRIEEERIRKEQEEEDIPADSDNRF